MKAVVCLVLVALVASSFAAKAVTDELINEVNSKQTAWKAGHNMFSKMELSDAKKLLGTVIPKRASRTTVDPPAHKSNAGALPTSFSAMQQWPQCPTIGSIRNQAQCGSCWAFSATEVLGDRFCVGSNGTTSVLLSPQDLVSCDTTDDGCNGGQLSNAWHWMESQGVVTDACMPYTSGGGNSGTCPSKCANGSPFVFYKAKDAAHVGSLFPWKNCEEIQAELMTNGPVQAAFTVYQDFMSYTSGVYVHTSGSELGGHAVKLVGWGVDSASGLPYWNVANSWTANWGMDGFFWILRGKDECGFESGMWAGLAVL
jgi:cathepsin B